MFRYPQFIRISIALASLVAVPASDALDGAGDVFFTVPSGESTGWKTFEIITGEDTLGTRAVEGFDWADGNYNNWDGLGAYLHDNETLRVFVNHETSADSTFTRVDLNLPSLKAWIAEGTPDNTNNNQIRPDSDVVVAVSRGWLDGGSGADQINRLCTGNVWLADTFGAGLGFADSVYMTGEEVFSPRDGHIWLMDLATRFLYEAPYLGDGSWENATIINTGRTDTIAILLSEDNGENDLGTAPIVLYVGEKDDTPGAGFLARNGLVGGNLYYWHVGSAGTNGTISGIFSGGNGSLVSGSWENTEIGAVLFSKSEDVHTNMDKDSEGFGLEVALASQKEAVFIIDCSELNFDKGQLASAGRQSDIQVLYQALTQLSDNEFEDMDNLVWSADGNIYVNEDDGEGDIWVIEVDSLLASYADGATAPAADQVCNILDAEVISESSGIFDISEALGYRAGSIFLTNGYSTVTSNNQVAMAVAPDALLKVDVYDEWSRSFLSLNTPAKQQSTADPDFDGLDNATEFALGLLPDTSESDAPFAVELLNSSSLISFTAARSLDLVDYYVDYTEDLSLGFSHTIHIKAADVGSGGSVMLSLPKADQLFARIRAVLP